jgi:hypothetical protein
MGQIFPAELLDLGMKRQYGLVPALANDLDVAPTIVGHNYWRDSSTKSG